MFWRRKQLLISPKGITKIVPFFDFKITICVASVTSVLFTRKMPMKARTICLYRLLEIKSIIEAVEGQIAKTTMCFVARGFGKTVTHLAKPETSAVDVFSDRFIDKEVLALWKMWKFIQNSEFHIFLAFCLFGFALIHKTHVQSSCFVN